MSFPKSGRIIIIDDEISQAKELMESLSKLGISYSYLTGLSNENIPEESELIDLRLLILDLNLGTNVIANNEKTERNYKAQMYGLLNRVIKDKAYYILVVWGREEDLYLKLIKELFSNELVRKKPFKIFSLNKSDYFDLEGNKLDDEKDLVTEISEKLNRGLNETPSFQAILDWENCVISAANKTFNSFHELITDHEKYEEEASYILYCLSKAYLGNQFNSNKSTFERKIKSGLLTLNEIFSDSLEKIILSPNCDISSPLLENKRGQDGFQAQINRKILISDDTSDTCYPGVVFSSGEQKPYDSILNDCLKWQNILETNHTYNNVNNLTGVALDRDKKKDEKRFCKEYRKEQLGKCLRLKVHVSPLCDYAQDKIKFARLLFGLLIPKEINLPLIDKSEYLYNSDFIFHHEGTNYFMVLDFRYLQSIPIEDLSSENSTIFRIRNQWLSDIQSRLSRHVNRPGILHL